MINKKKSDQLPDDLKAIVASAAEATLLTRLAETTIQNVNSSHIAGSKVVNGLGGEPNFAQNALLSIVVSRQSPKMETYHPLCR